MMMMYETAVPLEPEGDMTGGEYARTNPVSLMETDGLRLSSLHCWGWSGTAFFSQVSQDGRFNMPATLPSMVVLHHGGVTVETHAGVMWGLLEEP